MENPRGWQVGLSLTQCNKYMLDNAIACDIKIQLTYNESARDIAEIPAHKYMLVARSPVFEAMLCGDFKETSTVVIPDIEPDSFIQLLSYMYCEEAEITADNVLHLLFAAKKYMVDGLVALCITFLKQNIDEDNVCSILNHCILYEEQELIQRCLKYIGPRAKDILNSQSFLGLSLDGLSHVVKYDRLNVDSECQVLTACKKWAVTSKTGIQSLDENSSEESDEESAGLYNTVTDEEVRSILGNCLYNIRFACMRVEEFANSVGSSKLLSDEESRTIFCHLTTWKYTQSLHRLGFNTQPRPTTYDYVRRFWEVSGGWNYERSLADAISFQVDRPVWIMGVSLYGGENVDDEHSYVMDIYDGLNHRWMASCKGTIQSDGTGNPIPILHKCNPQRLDPGAVHTIKINITGAKSYFGEHGMRNVKSAGVKFTFTSSSESLNETFVGGGQIPEIIFRKV